MARRRRVAVLVDDSPGSMRACRYGAKHLLDKNTDVGAINSKSQLQTIQKYIDLGEDEGATYHSCQTERLPSKGYWCHPCFFTDVQPSHTIAREEIFGPVLSVLEFDTEAEVLARANDTDYGLAAGVFTQNLPRAHRMVKALEAGTCYINTYNDAPVEAPFGGVKLSGVGRENSKAAINHYSQLKSVYVRLSPLEAPY